MLIASQVFVEGYSSGPGLIAYRATHIFSGVTTERRADLATHAPERFPENLTALLTELEQKVRDSYRTRQRS